MPKNIQLFTLGLIVLSLLAINTPAAQAANGVAKIFKLRVAVIYPDATRATFRVPKDIKLKSWVTCDAYDTGREIIGSVRHMLNTRVVNYYFFDVVPSDVYFILCHDFEG